ncbi:MAG: L-histidine N(alpha)-methyltransferase [Labilithrix sp.]|nr:L-histidine N(alpha)-methyltransferase [Labilithrix sp.]MBX3220836.1 L-histidine N(alpha)-methyltransferase [Labilithrix sp.]
MTPLDGTHDRTGARSPLEPAAADFRDDAMAGLRSTPKRLSPKYFYDTEGSQLFDAICELPEYYVTRTELSILEAEAGAIASRLAAGGPCRVVEPGAGSGTKTRLLLRALGPERCVDYVPVDIAGEHLERTAVELRAELPWLRVTPFAADFSLELPLPGDRARARTVVYFPGSTIGNFDPADAERLLGRFREAAGPDGLVLLGVDLKKDPAELHAAYNDARGVTARFNKNVLRRMNVELGTDFDLDAFHHYAFYAPAHGRIEMHLVSVRRQEVRLGGEVFTFEDGESICTERSYKYDLATAERLGRSAGLALVDSWRDAERRFAVLLFRAPAPA